MPVLCLDDAPHLALQPEGNPSGHTLPAHLAYVIYTSGSTGRPKGTLNSHRGIVNRLLWMQERYRLTGDDRVLQKTPYSFDVSVWEFFWPLLTGARLVIAEPGGHQDPVYLIAAIEAAGITTIHFVPSMLQAFLEAPGVERCAASLVRVVCSGEALPPEMTRRFFARLPGVELHNLYGPTEAAVDVTFWACDPADRRGLVPIGRPVANTQMHVVDRELRPVPVGVAGELLIGGVQVGRGYLARPELTAERFVPDGLGGEAGARLYRTGDLGRWWAGGEIEYLGRIDHQVKLRGVRIELGEIESQLRSHPAVRDAVVVAREDRAGDPRLVAYVVGGEAGALRAHVVAKLPEAMVPSVFVLLDALPLTASGKVDRKALPAPEMGEARRGAYVAPRTELERVLCGIWADVLGLERVGIDEGFFDLGGHSLLAARVVSRVRAALGRELPLRAMFEHPTIGGLCAKLPELTSGLALPPIEIVADRDDLPLSFAQQRLWFIDRLEGGSSHYNVAGAGRVRGELDLAAFARALRTIVERHEPLRTVFREVGDRVVQVIRRDVDFQLASHDLSGLTGEEREREVWRRASEDARRPFDLSRDLLLRAGVLKLAEQDHVLLFNMHHIASDGWSMGVLIQELVTLYAAYRAGEESPLPPLCVQYADYAQWQRQWLRGEILDSQLGYWRRQLAGVPQVHALPLDRPRPSRLTYDAGLSVQRLDGRLQERIAARCRESGVTLFMFLQAAFSVLLSRYSQEKDVVVGSPIAGRVHRDVEPLIGFFVNTLVLRSDLSANPRFVDLLESSRQTILDAYAHQHVPFEMLVEELKPERSLSHSPLFQILMVLQNAEQGVVDLGGLRLEPVGEGSGVVKFDLELNLTELAEGLAVHWSYMTDLFDGATIERMAAGFAVLLPGIVEGMEERVQELPLLTAAERRRLSAWDPAAAAYPRDLRIHELFEAQVGRSPHAVAVVSDGGRWTYAELDERANRLAHHLIGLGVGEETLVGLCAERSLEMVAGILGILKAGGVYVPLDPEYPEARLASMVDDTGVEVVLAQDRLAGMSCFAGRRTVSLDDPALGHLQSPESPALPGRSSDLAYVIYTSGSTGRPKGAMVEHRSVVRLVIGPDFLPLGADTVMLQASSVSFDAATLEIWGPLLNGGRLVLYPERVPEIEKLNEVIERHGVNTAWLTAGLFDQWSDQVPPASPLRWVLTGGDVVDPLAVARVYAALPEVEVINGYGPTENTTFTTCYSIPRGHDPRQALPLGRPISGTGVVVLQENRDLAAPGAAGELCALGDGVARGYLNRPELTAERFLANPYAGSAGSRLYRTGDRARWRVDGTLEFLGRKDDQVKIRGFRVELGEIEAQLRLAEPVRDAVVLAREDRPGEKRLVAYVVGREGGEPDAGRLRAGLAAKLPEHMVPSVFVVLETLPLTANGKVDRAALPAPQEKDFPRDGYAAPRTELERRLCEIWEELLGVERVGIADSFFDLGGHSLLATRAVSRVRSDLHREIPLRAFFEHPTIEGICAELAESSGGWVLPPIEVLAEREGLALSYAQQRLWFIDRLEGGSSHYNVPGAVRVKGRLDTRAFARAMRTIVDRHESLRTVFREVNGQVVQVVRAEVALALAESDLSGLGAEEQEREVRRLALEDARRPFDLSRDLLLRVGLLKLADEAHVVLFNMHHIASDGWSMGVLMRELAPLYEAYRAGGPDPLPPLSVQSADYAEWQRQWLEGEVLETQLGYWREQLNGLPLIHNLPLDKPRPARQGFEGGERVQRLGTELKERIEAACRTSRVTPFMFLEAAFAVLLSRYSNETDIVVGSPIAGRVHRDVEPLIGFFVNTLVLRSDLAA
ncbi:MAG TPA: amino acid adenylation domain-containing protein, partial [Thermoanaerobaculia bacterium]|nr:amino acid adenylation domain-containing protein [Thermoanaerobaculia bacterium]